MFAARALLALRAWFVAVAIATATLVAASPAEAQTVTVSLSATLVDTVATVAKLTGTSSRFYRTLTVSITGCGNGAGSRCRVYMSASPTSSTLVSNLSWGTSQSGCTDNTVQSGTTPSTSGTFIYSRNESNGQPNGSTTIYLCYVATLSWSVAPQRFAPNFYFTVIRQ